MSDWGAHPQRRTPRWISRCRGPTGRGRAAGGRRARRARGEAAVDEKVRRLLRLAARVGARDASPSERRRSRRSCGPRPRRARARPQPRVAAAAHRPLRKVAVIGPNGADARTLGGGSATVFPSYTVSPLEGLRAALDAEVTFAPGVNAHTRLPVAKCHRESLPRRRRHRLARAARDGRVHLVRPTRGGRPAHVDHGRGRGPARDRLSGVGRFTLTLDGTAGVRGGARAGPGRRPGRAAVRPAPARRPGHARRRPDPVELRCGAEGVTVVPAQPSTRRSADASSRARSRWRVKPTSRGRRRGTTPEVESEGFDRTTLGLAGRAG